MKIRIVYERQVTTLDVPDEECAITIRTDYEMRLAAAEDKESVAPSSMQEIMDEQINRPEVNQDRRFNDHNVTESALAGDDDEDPFFDLIPDTRQEEGEEMKRNYEETCRRIRKVLKPDAANLVITVALDGVPIKEYARLHNEDQSAVSHRYRRALKKIKKYF